MSLKAWLLIAAAGLLIIFISIGVAYYRGKKVGAYQAKPTVTQYDQKALEEVQKQVAQAKAELALVTAEADKRRKELEDVSSIKDEEARLQALADLANKWGSP